MPIPQIKLVQIYKESWSVSPQGFTKRKGLTGWKFKNCFNQFVQCICDLVVKKLVSNASSQINESWHSTVGSKAPKIRFYGGSESSDQRVAAVVAQTNLGKQYLLDTLHCLNVEPVDITEKNILSLDKEREAEKHRKSSIKFKKECRVWERHPFFNELTSKKVHYMPCRWFENEALRDNFIWYRDKLWRKGSWNNSISRSNWTGANIFKVCPTEERHFFPCFKSK